MIIKSSLHNHTSLSDGNNTPLQATQNALKCGFTDFGISDHGLVYFDKECSIPSDSVYKKSVNDVKNKLNGKINVYCGLEADLFSEIDCREEYDYIIGSVHYYKKEDRYFPLDATKALLKKVVKACFDGDFRAAVIEYYKNVSLCIDKWNCDIIGHFDLIRKFFSMEEMEGLVPEYKTIALDYLDECIGKNKIFEINTGGMMRGYLDEPYPCNFLLKRLIEKKAKLILSDDNHRGDNFGFMFDKILEEIKSFGAETVIVMENGVFVEKKI